MTEEIVASIFIIVLYVLLVLVVVFFLALLLRVVWEDVHPFEEIKEHLREKRCEKLPPCNECKWLEKNPFSDRNCVNPQGLELRKKQTGKSNLSSLDTTTRRGSRYCNFETRDDNE
jgi:hypothetical protein